MRTTLFVLALYSAAVPGLAHAGNCLSAEDDDEDVRALERFAAPKVKPKNASPGPWVCADIAAVSDTVVDGNNAKNSEALAVALRRRIVAACTKVIDRDGESGPCVLTLGLAGMAKVGDHDLFPLLDQLPEDPLDHPGWTKIDAFARMNDLRAVPSVMSAWKAAMPRAATREKKHRSMGDWSTWRQLAASVLGKLGGAEEKVFLEEQAGATKDKHVAQACRDGAAQIDKRLAASGDSHP